MRWHVTQQARAAPTGTVIWWREGLVAVNSREEPPAHQSLSIPPPSSPPLLHNDRAAPVSGLLDARSGTFCPLAAFKLWADSKYSTLKKCKVLILSGDISTFHASILHVIPDTRAG
ncbi:hypothetical protein NQZ68_029275 [Dissostichus eleginoides]|nr:hypothetical protein NQZ68_029275 [Dissostichus eleginoides]